MWECDEDWLTNEYDDDDGHHSDNSISSEIEAALYGQLHHESPVVIDDGRLTEKVTKQSHRMSSSTNARKERALLKESEERCGDEFQTPKQLSKSTDSVKRKILGNTPANTSETKSDQKKTKKKKRKKSPATPAQSKSQKSQKQNIVETPSGSTVGRPILGRATSKKNVNSKYDYEGERRHSRVSVIKEIEVINISSDTEKEVEIICEKANDTENATSSVKVKTTKNSEHKKRTNMKRKVEDTSDDDIDHLASRSSLPVDIQLNISEIKKKYVNSINSGPSKKKIKKSGKEKEKKKAKKNKKLKTGTDAKVDVKTSSMNESLSVEESMRKFYDSEPEEVDLDEKRKNLSYHGWKLDRNLDNFSNSAKRYFTPKTGSKMTGFRPRFDDKRHRNVCFLCSEENHTLYRCPNNICYRCYEQGHEEMRCPYQIKNLYKPCKLCKMPGHMKDLCPDWWRRYYLTTKPGPLIQGKNISSRPHIAFCYNCGKQGHMGHMCCGPRMKPKYPHSPFVISYKKLKTSPQKNGLAKAVNVPSSSEKVKSPRFSKKLMKQKKRTKKKLPPNTV